MTREEFRALVEKLLVVDHVYELGLKRNTVCRCGFAPQRDQTLDSQQDKHARHVAEVIAAAAPSPFARTARLMEDL